MDLLKRLLNSSLIHFTGYQFARPDQTLHAEGAHKRRFIEDFVTRAQPVGKILDIGAGPRSLKHLYLDVHTLDQRDMPGVDFVGDLHTLSQDVPHDFDTVVCTEVFEHTQKPWIAIAEIFKVLKPGGLFIGSAPLSHELHGEEYGDYWRITPQGWQSLLEDFTDVRIETRGVYPQINHVAVSARKPI